MLLQNWLGEMMKIANSCEIQTEISVARSKSTLLERFTPQLLRLRLPGLLYSIVATTYMRNQRVNKSTRFLPYVMLCFRSGLSLEDRGYM